MKTAILFLAVLTLAGGLAAQGYQIDWYSLNSGGIAGSNAQYLANGTAGQAVQDAGAGGGQLGYWGFWVPGEGADIGVIAIASPLGSVPYHSIVTPVARVHNYGTYRDPADVTFSVDGSFYVQTVHLASGLPFFDTLLAFPTFVADTGYHFCRCSTYLADDENCVNDTVSGMFVVPFSIPRWVRRTDVPNGNRLKRVKDGCALAYNEESDSGLLYAFKGNNTCEFYRYNVWTDRWASAESIPALGTNNVKKTVKKGAALTQIGGRLYGSKGNNTYDWWCYNPTVHSGSAWHKCALVPTGARAVREGAGCVGVTVQDTPCVYLLKGSGTCEFYRYNTVSNTWATMAPAPVGGSRKPFKNGSCLTYNPDCDTIYALKGSYNEFFAYSVSRNTWSSNEPLPRVSPPGSKSKKVKDGAGLAYHGNIVYALKGGNTYEFWKYPLDSHHWYPAEDFLAGPTMKRVKGGGALVYAPLKGNLYATKGNNTYEFYMYWLTDSIMGGRPARPSDMQAQTLPCRTALEIAPNPFQTRAAVAYSLSRPGQASLKLYCITGGLVRVLVDGYQTAGSHVALVTRGSLSAGVYVIRYRCEEYTETRKIVVE